jgi:hypothetical protein
VYVIAAMLDLSFGRRRIGHRRRVNVVVKSVAAGVAGTGVMTAYQLALDLSYHLVYGVAVAAAYAALDE